MTVDTPSIAGASVSGRRTSAKRGSSAAFCRRETARTSMPWCSAASRTAEPTKPSAPVNRITSATALRENGSDQVTVLLAGVSQRIRPLGGSTRAPAHLQELVTVIGGMNDPLDKRAEVAGRHAPPHPLLRNHHRQF